MVCQRPNVVDTIIVKVEFILHKGIILLHLHPSNQTLTERIKKNKTQNHHGFFTLISEVLTRHSKGYTK